MRRNGKWFVAVMTLAAGLAMMGDPVVSLREMRTPSPYVIDMVNLLHYTGKAFPSPQRVEYKDAFIDLRAIALVLGENVRADDPRVGLLKARIEGLGGKIETANPSATIYLNVKGKGAEAPDRAEGYAIRALDAKTVAVTAHDAQGLLWGIVSLAQLTRKGPNGPELRVAEIDDWPDNAWRGLLSMYWPRYAPEFLLFSKMNVIVFQSSLFYEDWDKKDVYPAGFKENNWRGPIGKDSLRNIQTYGKTLNDFGLNVYYSIWPIHPEYRKLSCSDPADFDNILGKACQIAEAGCGLYLAFDDARFPLTDADKARYGYARSADPDFAGRLYRAVKAKYPNFKMVFCPPFYFTVASHVYPEDRDAYLRSLGENLDPAIDVFWTGPRVKSSKIDKAMTAALTEKIRRKPVIFQNGKSSPHPWMYSYVSDPYDCWKTWYYDGFYQDLTGYCVNSFGANDAMSTATLAAALWNLKAYDADAAIKTAVNMYFGPEGFALADALREKLSRYDRYNIIISVPAVKNLKEIESEWPGIEKAWAALKAYNPTAAVYLTGMESLVVRYKGWIARLKNNKDLKRFAGDTDEIESAAAKEAAYRKGQDTLLAPMDFTGGKGPSLYGVWCSKRLATWIYGAKTTFCRLSANFECDPFPPSGDYKLFVSAQDDEPEKACAIEIKINDHSIYRGPSGFARRGWSVREFVIPADRLKRNNALTIDNIEDSEERNGPPWFMLNYAVLKKTK